MDAKTRPLMHVLIPNDGETECQTIRLIAPGRESNFWYLIEFQNADEDCAKVTLSELGLRERLSFAPEEGIPAELMIVAGEW